MKKVSILPAQQAIGFIEDNSTVAVGGFVGCAHPEALTRALERRFIRDRRPRNLCLIYAAGQGDGNLRGLNHLAHEEMVKRVIGGHWGLAPKLGRLALQNKIEAYNFPQGVISHLFRDIAAGNPGTITHIGLNTFVDPLHDGGKLNKRTTENLVERVKLSGQEWLLYKAFPVHFGLLRGTASDSFGNITFDNEVVTLEALSIAQAVKNSGGKNIVQVEAVVEDYSRDPKDIVIPGIFVDVVVVSDPQTHMQTYDEQFNPAYVQQGSLDQIVLPTINKNIRRYIAMRAFNEIKEGNIVNLGIGMPEGIARIALDRKKLTSIVLTVESGPIGGIPAGGLSFGASNYPDAIIDQPYMFDFYNGGGLDIAFLGMGECDRQGNVNVSKFSQSLAGIGGFMNISQSAKKVVFIGTFTAQGLEVDYHNGRLRIVQEGKIKKFVNAAGQITFSGSYAYKKKQEVLYITERAVFRLIERGIELIEVAPGINPDKDLLPLMEFTPKISDGLREMSQHIYCNE